MTASPDWWRDHYTGLHAEFWHSILPPAETLNVVEFIIRECQLRPGDTVLDVPCGEGRVALELARRGMQVRGVDISQELLLSAAKKSHEESLTIEWIHGDMRELSGSPCHAVCCLGDSFGYLDDAANLDFLRAARSMLEPGRRFVLEMKMLAEVLFPRFKDHLSGKIGEINVELNRRYYPCTGRLEVEYRLERGQEQDVRTASYRIYTCSDICRMLTSSGFHDLKLVDSTGTPFALGSERLRVVASAR